MSHVHELITPFHYIADGKPKEVPQDLPLCPFATCTKAVQKLSQHLKQVHLSLSAPQQLAMHEKAKVAYKGAQKPVQKPPTQQSILDFMGRADKCSDDRLEMKEVPVRKS